MSLAITGSTPKPIPPINAFDFTFSQPFLKDSRYLRDAPTQQQRDHSVPPVPNSTPIFVDALTGASITWQRIHDDASSLAVGLRELLSSDKGPYPTVSPVVFVHLPNSIDYISIILAIFASGNTACLVNPVLTPTELEHMLSLSHPAAIITTTSGYETIAEALKLMPDTALASGLSTNNRIFIHDPTSPTPPSTQPLSTLHKPIPSTFRATLLTTHTFTHHTALIVWSSGTTGKSKGVCLSHQNVVRNTLVMWNMAPHFTSHERWLGFAPFYHIFGFAVVAMMAPACGATVFVMPRFDAGVMLDTIEREQITAVHTAPPVALLLAKSPMVEGRDLRSVRCVMSGAAPLGKEVIEMVWRRLGVMVLMGYGISEAGCVAYQSARGWGELKAHLGDTGVPERGNEMKVVNVQEPGRVVKVGEEGEICVRSPGVFIGYLNNWKATGEVLDGEGWYHTGDIGKIDETGSLWITDRVKEMIKVKGFQVSPVDLDAILMGSPEISDAGVTSIWDDETQSEYPRAYLVPSNTGLAAQAIRGVEGGMNELASAGLLDLAQHVKQWTEQRLARYKWLSGGVVFVPQIPKSPSGKILRRFLKDAKGVEIALYRDEAPAKAKHCN